MRPGERERDCWEVEQQTCTTQQLVLAPLIWLTALCMLLGEENPSTPSVRMTTPVRMDIHSVCHSDCGFRKLDTMLSLYTNTTPIICEQ